MLKTIFEDNIESIITQEMRDYYYKRTARHINLVRKYCNRIYNEIPENFEIWLRGDNHDESKYLEPEIDPYIIITWDYKCKDDGIEFKISDSVKEQMNKATLYHIINNSHHPEYYEDPLTVSVNKDNRDSPELKKIIDAIKMPKLDILEMCADWCSMSEEKGNTPIEWAEKVIGKRYKFSDEQIKLIYETIEKIWRN